MRYSVGEVARMMGLTPGALHYYEREGIIGSMREGAGRRYYDDGTMWRLLSYEKYHSMQYPLKMVLDQFTNGVSRDVIRARVQDRLREAREKAKYYEKLAVAIESHVAGHARIDELLGDYAFERCEAVYFWHAEHGWMSKDRRVQDMLARWVGAMPATQLAAQWQIDGYAQTDQPDRCTFGFIITPELAELFEFAIPDGATLMPARSCLHTIVTCDGDFAYHPERAFMPSLQYAKARGLRLAGYPSAKVLMVEATRENLCAYIDVWIPIK